MFIAAETRSKTLNIPYHLFGEAVCSKFQIQTIRYTTVYNFFTNYAFYIVYLSVHIYSFNAVSATLLKKALKRICAIMSQAGSTAHYKPLSQDTLDSIVLTAQGDVRNAVINLHFASQKSECGFNQNDSLFALGQIEYQTHPFSDSLNLATELIPPSLSSSSSATNNRRQPNKSKKFKSLGCDATVTILHGVGRVLTPKCKQTFDGSAVMYRRRINSFSLPD